MLVTDLIYKVTYIQSIPQSLVYVEGHLCILVVLDYPEHRQIMSPYPHTYSKHETLVF